jgi:peptide/nickel transport system permease protein
MSTFRRISKYLLVRLLTIAATIFIGVYFTVVAANRGGFLDMSVAMDIDRIAAAEAYDQMGYDLFAYGNFIAERRAYWAEAFGLNQPQYLRDLRWTVNALTFNWGDTLTQGDPTRNRLRTQDISSPLRNNVRQIVVEHFPNTLLLVVTANLFVFLIAGPAHVPPLREMAGQSHGGAFADFLHPQLGVWSPAHYHFCRPTALAARFRDV